MNQYVFILNDKGERITSLCDNTLSRDDIMAQAEHDYPNAQYVYSADGDSMLDEFMSGKFYVDGKFVEPQAKEPTKAEKIAEIRGISAEQVLNASFENARALFSI